MRVGPYDTPGGYTGDCRDLLAKLPDESVHCVVTSPPYFALRDYGVDGQLGLETTSEEYIATMVEVFRDVRRVLRKDGCLWMNLGDTYVRDGVGGGRGSGTLSSNAHNESAKASSKVNTMKSGLRCKNMLGIPWRTALALQADGWYLRLDIIWEKTNPIPESVPDRPSRSHEYVFLLSRSERYYYDKEAVSRPVSGTAHPRGRGMHPKADDPGKGVRANESYSTAVVDLVKTRNLRSVWQIPTQPYKSGHFAAFPEKLAEPCILSGSAPKCCGVCGAPWVREIEVHYTNPGNRTTNGPRSLARRHETPGFHTRRERQIRTLGWNSSCDHDDDSGRSIILDPFLGTGTVGQVAERHGRLWLGFELNPAYETLWRERTSQQTLPGVGL